MEITQNFNYKVLTENIGEIYAYLDSIVDEHEKKFDRNSEPEDFIDAYLTAMEDNPLLR